MNWIEISDLTDMKIISVRPIQRNVTQIRQIDETTFETQNFMSDGFVKVCRWVLEEKLDVDIGIYDVKYEAREQYGSYAAYRFVFNNSDHAAYFKLRWS